MKTPRTLSTLLVAVILPMQAPTLNPTPARPQAAAPPPAKVAQSVTIYRDKYGVPHVYGPTDYSVMFGFIYAQAEDNFWQIEDSYIQALGRAAEVYGENGNLTGGAGNVGRALESDIINRQLGITRLAQEDYRMLGGRVQEICRATADGLNYFLAKNPQVRPRLLTRFEPWHLLAFNRFAQYQLFIFRRLGFRPNELRASVQEVKASRTSAERRGGDTTAPEDDGPYRGREEAAAAADPEEAWEAGVVGSNTWAVTPKKSAAGHAMLFINPHQPFFGPGPDVGTLFVN